MEQGVVEGPGPRRQRSPLEAPVHNGRSGPPAIGRVGTIGVTGPRRQVPVVSRPINVLRQAHGPAAPQVLMYLDVRVSVLLRRVDAFPQRVQSLFSLCWWLHASYVTVFGCPDTFIKRHIMHQVYEHQPDSGSRGYARRDYHIPAVMIDGVMPSCGTKVLREKL